MKRGLWYTVCFSKPWHQCLILDWKCQRSSFFLNYKFIYSPKNTKYFGRSFNVCRTSKFSLHIHITRLRIRSALLNSTNGNPRGLKYLRTFFYSVTWEIVANWVCKKRFEWIMLVFVWYTYFAFHFIKEMFLLQIDMWKFEQTSTTVFRKFQFFQLIHFKSNGIDIIEPTCTKVSHTPSLGTRIAKPFHLFLK